MRSDDCGDSWIGNWPSIESGNTCCTARQMPHCRWSSPMETLRWRDTTLLQGSSDGDSWIGKRPTIAWRDKHCRRIPPMGTLGLAIAHPIRQLVLQNATLHCRRSSRSNPIRTRRPNAAIARNQCRDCEKSWGFSDGDSRIGRRPSNQTTHVADSSDAVRRLWRLWGGNLVSRHHAVAGLASNHPNRVTISSQDWQAATQRRRPHVMSHETSDLACGQDISKKATHVAKRNACRRRPL